MDKAMISAHKAPQDMQIHLNENLQVSKGVDRNLAGSCNACTPFNQVAEYTKVTHIHMRGLSLRLCPACAQKLKAEL